MQKVTVYKLSDGRTVTDRAEALKEQSKLDLVEKISPILRQYPQGKELGGVIIGALINAGWRPPAKKYKKAAK